MKFLFLYHNRGLFWMCIIHIVMTSELYIFPTTLINIWNVLVLIWMVSIFIIFVEAVILMFNLYRVVGKFIFVM